MPLRRRGAGSAEISGCALPGQHLPALGQSPQVQDVGEELQKHRDDRHDGMDRGTALDIEDIDDQFENRGRAEGTFDQQAGLQRHCLGLGIRHLVRQVGDTGQDVVGSEHAEDRDQRVHPIVQALVAAPDGADRGSDDAQSGHEQGNLESPFVLAGVDQADQVQDETDQGDQGRADPEDRGRRLDSVFVDDHLVTRHGAVRSDHDKQDNPEDDGQEHQQLSQPDLFDSTERVWKPHVFSSFFQ